MTVINHEEITAHFERHQEIEDYFASDTDLRDEFLDEIGYTRGRWSFDEITEEGIVYEAYYCGDEDHVTMPWSFIFDREGWREQRDEKQRQKEKEKERQERERQALQEQKDRATFERLRVKFDPQQSGRARRS